MVHFCKYKQQQVFINFPICGQEIFINWKATRFILQWNPSMFPVYITTKHQQAAKHHITNQAINSLATIQQWLMSYLFWHSSLIAFNLIFLIYLLGFPWGTGWGRVSLPDVYAKCL